MNDTSLDSNHDWYDCDEDVVDSNRDWLDSDYVFVPDIPEDEITF